MAIGKYVTEGKLRKGEKLIFIETEQDEKGYPIGTWLHDLVDDIPEGTNVKIVVEFEK